MISDQKVGLGLLPEDLGRSVVEYVASFIETKA